MRWLLVASTALLSILSLQAAPLLAQSFTVDALVKPTETVALSIPIDEQGAASLRLVREANTDPAAKFSLTISALRDPQGNPATAVMGTDPVTPPTGGQAKPPEWKTDLGGLSAPTGALRVWFTVTPPARTAKLTGLLTLTVEKSPPKSWTVDFVPVITRATLAASAVHGPRYLIKPNWANSWALDSFSHTVWDKSRTAPIQGLSVRVDQVGKASDNFDLRRNMAFTVGGKDLMADDPRSRPNVGMNEIGYVTGTVRDLTPGEYNVTLRYTAANTIDDDAQKVTMSMFVKDDWKQPLLVILAAVLISFYTTKIVVITRQRLALKARILRLESSWLRDEPPSPSIVWAQAKLRLARSLLKAAHWTIPDMVTEAITDVEGLLPTLRAIRDKRKAIEAAVQNKFVRERGLGKVAVQARAASEPPLTPDLIQQIQTALTALDAWCKPDGVMAVFWDDAARSIKAFLGNLRVDDIKDEEAKRAIQGLVDEVKGVAESVTPLPPIALFERFAALEIIWEARRKDELLAAVVKQFQASAQGDLLFALVDDDAWQQVVESKDKGASIVLPVGDLRAYEPFTLSVTTGNHTLDSTFLFKYKLKYRWTITIERARRWRSPEVMTLTPETLQPYVTQFSPWKGTMSVSVTIANDTKPPIMLKGSRNPAVGKSETGALVGSIERNEGWPLLITFAIAVLAALSTSYFGNATFGSAKDYLTLFLTGAAVDQGKNLLQSQAGK